MSRPAAKSSIASDSAYSLALKASLYVTGFGASILISRVLGPGGRGLYYLPVVTAATLTAFASLGLEQANVFMLGSRAIAFERLWAQAGLVAATLGAAGFAATVAAPLALPRLYAQTPALLLALAGLAIPFTLHIQFAAGLLALRGQVTWQFRAGLAGSVVHLALLATLFFSGRLGVSSVLWVALISTGVTWLIIAVRAAPSKSPWLQWDAGLLRDTLRQSLPLHLASIFLFLHLRLDMFMVSAFAGAAALGIYSLAVTLAETVQLASDSLSVALLPRQVGNSLTDAAALSLRGARANALVGFALATGWAAVGYPVIRFVFGTAFVPSYVPLLLLLPGIVLIGMQRACAGGVLRSGQPWTVAAIQGGSLATNAALNWWLIPRFGPAGASLASTISYGLATSVFLAWTARLAGGGLDRAIPRAEDVRAMFGAVRRLIPRRPGADASV